MEMLEEGMRCKSFINLVRPWRGIQLSIGEMDTLTKVDGKLGG